MDEVTKTIRAEILLILKQDYPEWTPRVLLKRVLEDRGFPISDQEFNGYLTFLRDNPKKEDGYVEFKESSLGPKRQKIYSFRLTALGIKLIEGVIEADPAIAI